MKVPAMPRINTALQNVGANANANKNTARPPRHVRKTGRRPMESASLPHKKPAKIDPRLNAEPR